MRLPDGTLVPAQMAKIRQQGKKARKDAELARIRAANKARKTKRSYASNYPHYGSGGDCSNTYYSGGDCHNNNYCFDHTAGCCDGGGD